MGEYKVNSIFGKKENRKIQEEMFQELLTIYANMQDYYNELTIALKEHDIYDQNGTLDEYLPVQDKIEYIQKALDYLKNQEKEVFCEYDYAIPLLQDYIKEMTGISMDTNFSKFSYFDIYTKFKYHMLIDKDIIIRMIRASEFYNNFFAVRIDIINQLDEQLISQNVYVEDIDDSQIINLLSPDVADVIAINTISALSMIYPENEVYYKNKVKLMFANPYIENYYVTNDLEEDHVFIPVELDSHGNRIVENNIIDSLFVIQKNDITNLNKKSKNIINSRYTLQQLIDIIFHFDKYTDKYDSRFEKYLKYNVDCLEVIELMHAFMHANYLMLSDQSVKDLDHLFSIMVDNESIKRGDIVLNKKIVDTFFTPLVQNSENKIIRTRKEDE